MFFRAKTLIALALVAGLSMVGCEKSEPEVGGEESQEAEVALETEETPESAEEEGAAEAPEHPVVGQLAPDFALPDENGEEIRLSDLRGKTVVLEWFNMDCPYVQRHYAEGTFDKILREFGGTDEIQWLAIDTTYNHTAQTTLDWKEEINEGRAYDYPVLQDPGGDVGRLYEAKTTPHMFVIDAEGILQYMGGIDDDPRGRTAPAERTNYVRAALQAMKDGEAIEISEAQPYGCTVKYDEES